ncbi:MAG TPA: orotidine 5'-phosphate decarboxylase / HUMPS family protein, partial [Candidatus Methylacidiphilales bacterium]
ALKGAEEGGGRTTVLGVTVLTSMDEAQLRAIGHERTPADHVLFLAGMAREAGLKGLVCSPLEIAPLRERIGKEMLLVTPGIRGAADRKGDQKRTLSAEEALALGASHLVVGRPITEAADPVSAAKALASAVAAVASR